MTQNNNTMAKLSKVFNKKTALDILYVGGGAVAGTFAGSKVYDAIKGDKADFDADGKLKPYIKCFIKPLPFFERPARFPFVC